MVSFFIILKKIGQNSDVGFEKVVSLQPENRWWV